MAKTPFIRPIAVQGGTFYTFSSSAEDLSLTFNNSLKNFKGSVLFTTHDHEFAQTVANRVLEITPKGVIDRGLTYEEYIKSPEVQKRREECYS